MNTIIGRSLSQLLVQSPILFVYLVGLVFAVVYWRRSPTPCLLAAIAAAVLLLVAVGQTFVSQYLTQSRPEMGWPHEQLGLMLSGLAFASSCLRAVAFGLLFAAVFLPRGATQPTKAN